MKAFTRKQKTKQKKPPYPEDFDLDLLHASSIFSCTFGVHTTLQMLVFANTGAGCGTALRSCPSTPTNSVSNAHCSVGIMSNLEILRIHTFVQERGNSLAEDLYFRVSQSFWGPGPLTGEKKKFQGPTQTFHGN